MLHRGRLFRLQCDRLPEKSDERPYNPVHAAPGHLLPGVAHQCRKRGKQRGKLVRVARRQGNAKASNEAEAAEAPVDSARIQEDRLVRGGRGRFGAQLHPNGRLQVHRVPVPLFRLRRGNKRLSERQSAERFFGLLDPINFKDF